MDRQTLDMEGARRGEISAASLQMGEDTIAIRCIATMSVDSMEFAPWDTESNRRAKSVHASLFVINLFFGFLALAWGGLFPGSQSSLVALVVGAVLLLLALVTGVRASLLARKMKQRQPYYRLVIGASDGRQIPLVDNNRDVLMRIRDVVRHKMDSGDRSVLGEFDLDLDLVNLHTPRSADNSPQWSPPSEEAPQSRNTTANADAAESEPDALFEPEGQTVRDVS